MAAPTIDDMKALLVPLASAAFIGRACTLSGWVTVIFDWGEFVFTAVVGRSKFPQLFASIVRYVYYDFRRIYVHILFQIDLFWVRFSVTTPILCSSSTSQKHGMSPRYCTIRVHHRSLTWISAGFVYVCKLLHHRMLSRLLKPLLQLEQIWDNRITWWASRCSLHNLKLIRSDRFSFHECAHHSDRISLVRLIPIHSVL